MSASTARDVALIAIGGAAGSVLRYCVGKAMGVRADLAFPWHTFVVNATGAFTIGLLVVVAARAGWPGWWRPLLAVGILGGYTTFSTFSLEVVELALRGNTGIAAVYGFGSLAAGAAGCAAGVYLGKALF